MGDPFRLIGRLMLAFFKITGYSVVYLVQAIWYGAHGRRDKYGDTIGFWGKATTDALADIFKH